MDDVHCPVNDVQGLNNADGTSDFWGDFTHGLAAPNPPSSSTASPTAKKCVSWKLSSSCASGPQKPQRPDDAANVATPLIWVTGGHPEHNDRVSKHSWLLASLFFLLFVTDLKYPI